MLLGNGQVRAPDGGAARARGELRGGLGPCALKLAGGCFESECQLLARLVTGGESCMGRWQVPSGYGTKLICNIL